MEKLEKEFRIPESRESAVSFSPTAVWCANGRVGQAHAFSASGISARVSTAKGRVPDPNCNTEIESESYTPNIILKNVEWGWRGQTPPKAESPTRGEETSSHQEERAIFQTPHFLVFEAFAFLLART